jgi:hypothetical protein
VDGQAVPQPVSRSCGEIRAADQEQIDESVMIDVPSSAAPVHQSTAQDILTSSDPLTAAR